MLIESLVGSAAAERVLLYLANYDEGYAASIARTFGLSGGQVQKQLDKFEQGGLLLHQPKGRTRLYTWNPRWPLQNELAELLEATLALLPNDFKTQYFRQRRRPRLKGKPNVLADKKN